MEKKFDNIDFFIFIATDPIFRHFWFSLLISLNNCLYLMCVKAEKFSWLLRVARAKTIWGAVYTHTHTHTPRKISWRATPREIGIRGGRWVLEQIIPSSLNFLFLFFEVFPYQYKFDKSPTKMFRAKSYAFMGSFSTKIILSWVAVDGWLD